MNKSESKYYNTACLMDQAMLILLSKKEFDYITVKEICEKAGVNRSTFYLHYDSTEDLLAESVEYVKQQLFEKFKTVDEINLNSHDLESLILYSPKYSIPYLEFIREYKRVFMAAISHPSTFDVNQTFNDMYFDIFEPIMEKHKIPDSEKKYVIKFYLSGIHAIIIEWIKNDCKDDLQFISDLIKRCIDSKIK